MPSETKWSIDRAHSEITFKVKHLMIAHVKGSFRIFDASIYTWGNDFTTAVIDLWIDASSITSDDEKRDEHLKSADFFDAANYKQLTFASSTMAPANVNGHHELWGGLTIKGISKKVKLDVHFGGILNDPWGNERAGFTVTGKINRSDWGLQWNAIIEAGGIMVSDEVMISCEFQLINPGQKEFKMQLPSPEENKIMA